LFLENNLARQSRDPLRVRNYSFKHIFGIRIKFSSQYPEKNTTKFGTHREKSGVNLNLKLK